MSARLFETRHDANLKTRVLIYSRPLQSGTLIERTNSICTVTNMASADVDLTGRSYVQDPSAPDPIPPHPGDVVNPQGRDGLDDLLDYDPQTDNIFGDVGPNNTTAPADGTTVNLDANQGNGDDGGRGLGIDEEVKVRKPRPPVAKLDETRLLSEKGIPRLRRISKDRLRFKGKGHEVCSFTSPFQLSCVTENADGKGSCSSRTSRAC